MSDDRFDQVTVVKKATVYFDGKVTSRTVLFSDGTRKTLHTGESFSVPVNSKFKLHLAGVVDYCCSYG